MKPNSTMQRNHTAGDRTPYTYVVRFPSLNRLYYGVRYGANCHPSELGVGYKSSSTLVKHLLTENSDTIFKVRKIFNSVEKAKRWETRVLTRIDAAKHPAFLNKQNNWLYPPSNRGKQNPMYGLPGTMRGRKHSPETLKKMREAQIGKTWNTGKHNRPESNQKARESQLGEKSSKFKGWYHTPIGTFASKRLAAEAMGVCVRHWCKHPDRIISKGAIAKSSWLQPGHLGLTFRELGFAFTPSQKPQSRVSALDRTGKPHEPHS